MDQPKRVKLEDDTKEDVGLLVERRIPWLFVGLLGGLLLTFISSKFESVLSENISLAFFIPIIVYMSDAIGTQAQTIFIRNSTKKQMRFVIYLVKEFSVGILIGSIFGLALGVLALVWFKSVDVAISVGLAMFVNMSTAPVIALFIAKFLQKEKTDPALGSGPFSTIIQDMLSLLIYFAISTLIILR